MYVCYIYICVFMFFYMFIETYSWCLTGFPNNDSNTPAMLGSVSLVVGEKGLYFWNLHPNDKVINTTWGEVNCMMKSHGMQNAATFETSIINSGLDLVYMWGCEQVGDPQPPKNIERFPLFSGLLILDQYVYCWLNTCFLRKTRGFVSPMLTMIHHEWWPWTDTVTRMFLQDVENYCQSSVHACFEAGSARDPGQKLEPAARCW